jgi:hypothetical protein
MSVETELRAVLLANTAVAAAVGTRIYPAMRVEDTALPAIVYTTRRVESEQALAEQAALAKSTLRYECVATTLATARDIAEKVRQAIAGRTAALGTIGRVAVRHLATEDLFIEPFDGSGDGLFSVTAEFEIHHAIPAIGA